MTFTSRRKRNRAMRFIVSYYFDIPFSEKLNIKSREFRKYCKDKELTRTLSVLSGMGYITFQQHNEQTFVSLTKDGACYFERKADEFRRFWICNVFIPILLSAITAIITSMIATH